MLLWGSHTQGTATPRSDLDLCVVAGPHDKIEAFRAVLRCLDRDADVHVFEELPHVLRGAVLDHHEVLMSRDEGGLYEYLRPHWKVWRVEKARARAA